MKNGNYHKGIDICWKNMWYQLEAYVCSGTCSENEIILMMWPEPCAAVYKS